VGRDSTWVLGAGIVLSLLGVVTSPSWALEKAPRRAPTDDSAWRSAGTVTIAYYNACTGWTWSWTGFDPGDQVGTVVEAPGPDATLAATGQFYWGPSLPAGYGFTGTIAVTTVDGQQCPDSFLDGQAFLPYQGWNTYSWSTSVPDTFAVTLILPFGAADYLLATDHPAAGPTGPPALGVCYPSSRTSHSFVWRGGACPGEPFFDGAGDAELFWEAVVVVPPPTPDLTVVSAPILSPDTVATGGTVMVGPVTIGNAGTADADSFFVSYHWSADATLTPSDSLLATFDVPFLAAGGETLLAAQLTSVPPDAPRGDSYVGVLVDGAGVVPDSDPSNNQAVAPFVIECASDYLAYYPFEGSAKDHGCAGNDGSLVGGGFGADACGNAARAYLLAGDDYVDCGDVLNDLELPLSVSLWLHSSDPSRGLLHSDADESSSALFGFWLEVKANKLEVGYGDGTSNRHTLRSDVSVPVDQWVHVVGVVRGLNDMDLYQDGVSVGTNYSGGGGAMLHGPGQLNLGRSTTVTSGFDGTLDDVRIYDRDLSAAEVQGLFSLGACYATSALQGGGVVIVPRLEPATPNPFSESVQIRFALPGAQLVRLAVYDVHGRLIRVLRDGVQSGGSHVAPWDGRDEEGLPVPGGVFFYRLTTPDVQLSRKSVRLR